MCLVRRFRDRMPEAVSIFTQTKHDYHLETAWLNVSKLGRGISRYQRLRWHFAKQGGTTGINSRPYREWEFFYFGKEAART